MVFFVARISRKDVAHRDFVTPAPRISPRATKLRVERSNDEVARRLSALRTPAQGTENLMRHIYEAVKVYATLGKICAALRDVFGTHEEAAVT